ncbi:amidohydrolase [Bacillus sp. HMF5848]|uniref:amidohydrolase family protein n=1 Tax=Bacillus sp. HMF5848 TaxID=2495421 RepID=UPI000F787907|nr:amidohydrolase family protein [Bacillus sp. HMF5848]RSK27312.1 amidohydrolase [Bacillus sp. HMF5848]
MKIIDAHMHYSNIGSFHETANELSRVSYSYHGIIDEYKENNVILGIAMGVTETTGEGFPDSMAESPMGIDLDTNIPDNIVYCIGVNPHTLTEKTIVKLEQEIQMPKAVGFKIYLGYYPVYAYDEIYQPIYRLAAKYDVPVVFHTGDTYSDRGLLKYSHPLTLDEVAVMNRDVNFVMAHLGDPWVLDGAEVVYKNPNMYADLSGLVVGTAQDIDKYVQSGSVRHLEHALAFCNHYEKLLFGTDWPLIPVDAYIDFIKKLIPTEYHHAVFYHNAYTLFKKAQPFIR